MYSANGAEPNFNPPPPITKNFVPSIFFCLLNIRFSRESWFSPPLLMKNPRYVTTVELRFFLTWRDWGAYCVFKRYIEKLNRSSLKIASKAVVLRHFDSLHRYFYRPPSAKKRSSESGVIFLNRARAALGAMERSLLKDFADLQPYAFSTKISGGFASSFWSIACSFCFKNLCRFLTSITALLILPKNFILLANLSKLDKTLFRNFYH